MLKKIILSILLIILLPTAVPASDADISAEFPSLISSIRVKGPLRFCGEPVLLNDPEMRERMDKELLLILWDRAQVILWAKRAARCFPHIEKVLKAHNLPDDLKYVSVIESALRPHAGSSKGAVGYWQFIRSTGRIYGLRVDRDIDERRNLFTSTAAAARYFKKLHGDFGSWTLAAAAYNMGEMGLAQRIKDQKTADFYHLYLPQETQRYVFRIIAVKTILKNLPKYGFHLKKSDLYQPLSFDLVTAGADKDVPVQLIAEAAGTYFKTIKDMNPQIRGNSLVRGEHSIFIPKGRKKGFARKFNALSSQYIAKQASRKIITHRVKRGEYLSRIASKYGVPLSDLLRWNKLRRKSAIHPGQKLIIKK